jgi:hypothetical protein
MAKDKRRDAAGKKTKPAKGKTPGKGVSALVDAAVARAATDMHDAASRAREASAEQAVLIGALRAEIDSLRRDVEALRAKPASAGAAKPRRATPSRPAAPKAAGRRAGAARPVSRAKPASES